MAIFLRRPVLAFFMTVSMLFVARGQAAEKKFFNIELGCCFGRNWVSQLDVVKENQKNIVKEIFEKIGVYAILDTSSVTRYQMDDMGNLAYRYNLIIQSSGGPSANTGTLKLSTLNMKIKRSFIESNLPKILIEFDLSVEDLKIFANRADEVEGFEFAWKNL